MRTILLLLVVAAMASAFGVQADLIDVKDTGNENLEALDVSIFVDCDLKNLTVEVRGQDSEEPVAGASTYLFYTDYEYQLIATGNSGADGRARMNVLGNIDYLTALFILRVDKSGYRSREVEFAYERCFREPPPVVPPAEEPEEEPEESAPPAVKPPAEQPPVEDVTPPGDGAPTDGAAPPDDDGQAGEEAPAPGPPPAACPLGLALLSVVFLKARR